MPTPSIPAEIGTPFDLEDTFGLHDETVFRVDASWRMGERHLLRAMYFDSHRGGAQRPERRDRFRR